MVDIVVEHSIIVAFHSPPIISKAALARYSVPLVLWLRTVFYRLHLIKLKKKKKKERNKETKKERKKETS